jgi:hypothetical protein
MPAKPPSDPMYDECWEGYEKVPGKKRGEEGSCRKKGEKEKRAALLARVLLADFKVKQAARKEAISRKFLSETVAPKFRAGLDALQSGFDRARRFVSPGLGKGTQAVGRGAPIGDIDELTPQEMHNYASYLKRKWKANK